MNKQLQKFGDKPPPGCHVICPIALFDDSTLCDNIGRLLAQPALRTVGNTSDALRRNALSWPILGMAPPCPKPSKEREADRKSKKSEESFLKRCHGCLKGALAELQEL